MFRGEIFQIKFCKSSTYLQDYCTNHKKRAFYRKRKKIKEVVEYIVKLSMSIC